MPSPPSRTAESDQLDSDPLRMTRACPQTCLPLAALTTRVVVVGVDEDRLLEPVHGGGAPEAVGVALLRSRVGPREGHPTGGPPREMVGAPARWPPGRRRSGWRPSWSGWSTGSPSPRPKTAHSAIAARTATTSVTPVSSIVGLISWRSTSSSAAGARSGRPGRCPLPPRHATGRPGSCPPRRRRPARPAVTAPGRGEVTLVCPAAGIDVEPLSGGYAGWLGRGCGSAWALRTACGLRTRVRSSSSPAGLGVWSARVVWPCSSSTTIAVRGKRCSCSISCRARAKASAVAGRLLGVLGHRLPEQPLERDRHVGAAGARDRVGPDPRHQGVGRVVPAADLERRAADQQLPERGGQAVDVGAGVAVRLPEQHLGRGPRHGDADVVGLLLGGGATATGDAEVGEARGAVLADQDVGGLDVAVRDAGAVRGLDGAGQLDADAQHLLDGEPLRPGPHRHVRRRVVLHDEVGAAVGGGLGAEHLDDVGVVGELGHGVGLVGELAPDRRGQALALEHLDRDVHPRHLLLVEEHVGVAARPDRLDVDQARDLGRRRGAHAPTS